MEKPKAKIFFKGGRCNRIRSQIRHNLGAAPGWSQTHWQHLSHSPTSFSNITDRLKYHVAPLDKQQLLFTYNCIVFLHGSKALLDPPPLNPDPLLPCTTLTSTTPPDTLDSLSSLFTTMTLSNNTPPMPGLNSAPPAPTIAFSTPTFRFPHPESYTGARDGFLCEIWLTSVNRFFAGARIPDDQRTLHAVIFLTGDAALWWEGNALQDTAPWDQFTVAFRSAFQPAGFIDLVRTMLFDIKMTSTVSDYVARTRKYLSILCPQNMNTEARLCMELATVSCFLKGAPKNLRQVLETYRLSNSASQTTIHDLCAVAEQFDQIYDYSSSSSSSSAATSFSAASAHGASNSAMEIDNLRTEVNALRRIVQASSSSRLGPLTSEERSRLIREGGCFKCRQVGHHQRDCPQKKRALNHIATESTSTAGQGNAPGDRV